MLDDADFDTAALVHRIRMVSHAGQGCAITTRMLVPRTHHDEIVETGRRTTSGWCATATRPTTGTYMGPLISEKQRDKVDGMVKRAVEAGATLVTGGEKVEPGLLLCADAAHRRRPGQRDRPGRGVRTGAGRDRLRRRRRRRAHRQQLHLRAVRRGVRQRGPRASRWRAASAPAPSRINGGMLLRPGQPVRRLQAVRDRPGDGRWPGSRSSWSARPLSADGGRASER